MLIEIWSDVVCPWCYVGKRRLETALESFAHADEVEVRYRSFQLDPTATPSSDDDPPGVAAKLADKYGVGIREAEDMVARVEEVAAQDGIEMHQDRARGRSTLDAHRLLHAAADRGAAVQADLKQRLLSAYFTDGQRIDDPVVLERLAVASGLDADEVRLVLDSDRYADAVREDQAQAAAFGARGVPFFVVDRRLGMSGAQPVEAFTQLLEQAWSSRTPVTVLAGAGTDTSSADACGPDGCAL
ncbi:DsbA family oxidoreductase [Thalassiella azotivora]